MSLVTSSPTKRPVRSVSVDILLPKYKTAILVHGCFWHRHRGCKNCTTPTNRRAWWLAKLNGNAARDKLHQAALRKLGWKTIVVWECETEKPGALERFRSQLVTRLSDLTPALRQWPSCPGVPMGSDSTVQRTKFSKNKQPPQRVGC